MASANAGRLERGRARPADRQQMHRSHHLRHSPASTTSVHVPPCPPRLAIPTFATASRKKCCTRQPQRQQPARLATEETTLPGASTGNETCSRLSPSNSPTLIATTTRQ